MPSDRSVKEQLGVELPEPQAPVEAPEVAEALEAPERPEWLPEKFKDEAEFATSYHSLEDELRRRGEEQRGLQEQIENLTALVENFQQPQQYQQPQQQQQFTEQLLTAYEQDPVGTMIFLAQQAADERFQSLQQQQQPRFQQQQEVAGELMANNAERVLSERYPDWNEYGPKVGDILERNPALIGGDVLTSLDRTTEVLEAIYKQVKYDDVAAQLEAASQDQTSMKRQAQTLSGNAGRPGPPNPDEEKINRIVAAAKNSSYSAFRSGG